MESTLYETVDGNGGGAREIRRPSAVHTTDQIVGQACRNGLDPLSGSAVSRRTLDRAKRSAPPSSACIRATMTRTLEANTWPPAYAFESARRLEPTPARHEMSARLRQVPGHGGESRWRAAAPDPPEDRPHLRSTAGRRPILFTSAWRCSGTCVSSAELGKLYLGESDFCADSGAGRLMRFRRLPSLSIHLETFARTALWRRDGGSELLMATVRPAFKPKVIDGARPPSYSQRPPISHRASTMCRTMTPACRHGLLS